MIKNLTYKNVEGITLVEFGTGTVRIGVYAEKEEKFVSMSLTGVDEPHEIGSYSKEKFSTIQESKPDVILTFSKSSSVRVLIEELWKLELELTNREMTAVKNVRDIEVVDDSEIKE